MEDDGPVVGMTFDSIHWFSGEVSFGWSRSCILHHTNSLYRCIQAVHQGFYYSAIKGLWLKAPYYIDIASHYLINQPGVRGILGKQGFKKPLERTQVSQLDLEPKKPPSHLQWHHLHVWWILLVEVMWFFNHVAFIEKHLAVADKMALEHGSMTSQPLKTHDGSMGRTVYVDYLHLAYVYGKCR